MAHIGAWRFAGLELAAAEADGGLGAGPSTSPSGGIALIGDDAAVRQAIILLLSTIPGERVMRPDYGCPLHRLVFNPNDATTAGLAIHYVRQALLKWEPRIEIVRLDAGRGVGMSTAIAGPEDERLYIYLDYRIRATNRQDRLAISMSLAGETA